MAVTLIDEDIAKLVTEDFEKMMQKVVKERVQQRCEVSLVAHGDIVEVVLSWRPCLVLEAPVLY